jgi:hypothetical protein
LRYARNAAGSPVPAVLVVADDNNPQIAGEYACNMTVDISIHKILLFQILKDNYSDTTISSYLGFKGGTAALMF